jgi:hypothetical protein
MATLSNIQIQFSQVLMPPAIGFFKQALVKQPLVSPRLVSCHQQHGLAQRIKGKRNAPHFSAMPKAQFFHVAVLTAFETVNRRSAKPRPIFAQQEGVCQQLILDIG